MDLKEEVLIRLQFLSVMISTIWLHNSSGAAINQGDLSSTTSLYQRICSTDHCRNGQCYVIGNSARCVCDDYYKGDRCEHVNMDPIQIVIIGSMVIFQWPWPPRMKGYSFVYYQIESRDKLVYKHAIEMSEEENSVLVGNLQGGRNVYKICIEDDFVAQTAIRTGELEQITNCVNIQTEPDYHSLVGWILAGMICGLVVLLIYWQKDKIELLYFHKPLYLYERPSSESADSDSQTNELTESSKKISSESYQTTSDNEDINEKGRKIAYQPNINS